MSVDAVIAVHPPFAWLLDWAELAAAGPRWFLVTGAESRERLAREGRLARFADVVVAPAFDAKTLYRIVEPWVSAAPHPGRVRLATMIEPVQMVLAELRRRLGVPGPTPEELRPFTDKLAMKAAMRGVEAHLPRYLPHDKSAFAADPGGYVARVVRTLGLPVFAKPISENSSAGTGKIETEAELVSFLSTSPFALELDEFVEGEGYHLDSVVLDGRVAWFGAGRYAAPQGQTLHGAPLAGLSISPGDPLYLELERLNASLLGAFARVPDGCTHMEVLRRPDGRFVFLEVAARVPGVRCPEMHHISRGLELRQIHYRVQAGLHVDLTGRRGPHVGYYCPMKTDPGRIARVLAPPFESEHTVEWSPRWLERTDVARTMSQADCLGFFVLWSKERGVLERDLARLAGFRPYEIEAPR